MVEETNSGTTTYTGSTVNVTVQETPKQPIFTEDDIYDIYLIEKIFFIVLVVIGFFYKLTK